MLLNLLILKLFLALRYFHGLEKIVELQKDDYALIHALQYLTLAFRLYQLIKYYLDNCENESVLHQKIPLRKDPSYEQYLPFFPKLQYFLLYFYKHYQSLNELKVKLFLNNIVRYGLVQFLFLML